MDTHTNTHLVMLINPHLLKGTTLTRRLTDTTSVPCSVGLTMRYKILLLNFMSERRVSRIAEGNSRGWVGNPCIGIILQVLKNKWMGFTHKLRKKKPQLVITKIIHCFMNYCFKFSNCKTLPSIHITKSYFSNIDLLGKRNNKKNQCSDNAYSPYLQDFYAVSSLTESTIPEIWAPSRYFTTEWLHKF